jgi:ketosteroid isomerase-like protein
VLATPLLLLCPLPLVALPQEAVIPENPAPPAAESVVTGTVEELRKAEMLLDADAMAPWLAHSFSFIEGSARVAGQFAYLESLRRARERGDTVRHLTFEQLHVEVFGSSAVATYRWAKRWKEAGTLHSAEGWCTDVFELRDDGAWILVHRHRSK